MTDTLDQRIAAFLAKQGADHTTVVNVIGPRCEECRQPLRRHSDERPSAFARRRFCDRACAGSHRAAAAPPEPDVCQCARPAPNGIGECACCHRLVLSHSWAEGPPPIHCTPTPVADTPAGSAIWDARDRRFMFIVANPPTDAVLQTVTFEDGITDDYDKRHTFQVADNTRAAELHNMGTAT